MPRRLLQEQGCRHAPLGDVPRVLGSDRLSTKRISRSPIQFGQTQDLKRKCTEIIFLAYLAVRFFCMDIHFKGDRRAH
jgi:hypothetical protein